MTHHGTAVSCQFAVTTVVEREVVAGPSCLALGKPEGVGPATTCCMAPEVGVWGRAADRCPRGLVQRRVGGRKVSRLGVCR